MGIGGELRGELELFTADFLDLRDVFARRRFEFVDCASRFEDAEFRSAMGYRDDQMAADTIERQAGDDAAETSVFVTPCDTGRFFAAYHAHKFAAWAILDHGRGIRRAFGYSDVDITGGVHHERAGAPERSTKGAVGTARAAVACGRAHDLAFRDVRQMHRFSFGTRERNRFTGLAQLLHAPGQAVPARCGWI